MQLHQKDVLQLRVLGNNFRLPSQTSQYSEDLPFSDKAYGFLMSRLHTMNVYEYV
jgi:hypothetical protein